MNYIILDLEWNQAIKKLHIFLEGEIIQIGAVKLNDTFEKIDTFKIGIAPKYYKKLHRKVAKLTQISEADFAYGFPFPTAFKYFKDWCGDKFILLTWGNDDLRILKANLHLHQLNTDWIPASYNLQLIFDRQIAHENRQCSLLYAMEIIHKAPLAAHDALHDALNTYEICKKLNLECAFAEYDTYSYNRITELYSNIAGQDANETIYSDKKAALRAGVSQEILCPHCQKPIHCIEWVTQNSSKSISLAECSCGQKYFIRIKLKYSPKNKYTAPMFIYHLDSRLIAYYIEKRLNRILKKVQNSNLLLPLYSTATVSNNTEGQACDFLEL